MGVNIEKTAKPHKDMTAKISAIIAQHITNESRLIIPEVGTLIRRKESGEIVFMEMLKKNDNVLIGLVVNILDVSPSKATEIVNQYIATIKQQLRTNKKFILDGVGVLLQRPDGGVDFSFNPFAQSLPEPEKNYDIIEEIVTPTPKPEPKQVTTPEPKPEPNVVTKPKVEPTVAAKPQAQSAAPKAEPQRVATSPKPAATPVAPKPTPKPAPKPAPAAIQADNDDEEEEYITTEPRKPRVKAHQSRRKVDGITVVALVAVALAIICIIWGMLPSNDNIELDLNTTPVEITE